MLVSIKKDYGVITLGQAEVKEHDGILYLDLINLCVYPTEIATNEIYLDLIDMAEISDKVGTHASYKGKWLKYKETEKGVQAEWKIHKN